MDRKSVWIVAGAILLGTLLLSLSQAFAQRNFRSESGSEGRAPRYQVVNVTEGEIIIMDVNSGLGETARREAIRGATATGSVRPRGSIRI